MIGALRWQRMLLVLGPLLLPKAIGCQVAQDERPPHVVDRLVAAMEARDLTAFAALLAPDVVEYRAGQDSIVTAYSGKGDLLDGWSGSFSSFSNWDVTVLDRFVSDNLVFQRERHEFTQTIQRPGGQSFDRSFTSVSAMTYQVLDGQVQALWRFPIESHDSTTVPHVATPAYRSGSGPVVHIDAGHFNVLTAEGSLWPFAELLRRDGYTVRTWKARFTTEELESAQILVIANPLSARDASGQAWTRPTPNALTGKEVRALHDWVKDGGRMLIVAGHMPYAGAVSSLASAFGVSFSNGFVYDTADASENNGVISFGRADGRLRPHAIVDRGAVHGRVDSVATFTGSAFVAPEGFAPLLVLPSTSVSFLPDTAYRGRLGDAPREGVGGWAQGAVATIGSGRVAFFAEGGLFRNLVATDFSIPGENWQFVLNLMHWLAEEGHRDRGSRANPWAPSENER